MRLGEFFRFVRTCTRALQQLVQIHDTGAVAVVVAAAEGAWAGSCRIRLADGRELRYSEKNCEEGRKNDPLHRKEDMRTGPRDSD